MSETAERFLEIFQGRPDAYGGDDGRAIWLPVTPALVEAHLDGIEGIGIYSIRHTSDSNGQDKDQLQVRWGCCDIDTGDWNEAYMLATALKGMGLVPHVERSRSKGWHVWVFTETWVPAWQMRRCLKVAYHAIDLPAKEANPKSELLQPSQLGNYVRLPFRGGSILNPERQCMMHSWDSHRDGNPYALRGWMDNVGQRGHLYSDPVLIAKWAAKWYEPPRALTVTAEALLDDEDMMRLVDALPSRLRDLWMNGPTKSDRSAALQGMAFALARLGTPPADVFQLVRGADVRWGKYHQRDNGEIYLADIVERAFQ